jgi:hypothetical protein
MRGSRKDVGLLTGQLLVGFPTCQSNWVRTAANDAEKKERIRPGGTLEVADGGGL